jgi:hypothetical protein
MLKKVCTHIGLFILVIIMLQKSCVSICCDFEFMRCGKVAWLKILMNVLIAPLFVYVVMMLRLFVGEGSCSEAPNSVPRTIVIGEKSNCSGIVESAWRASRK